MDLATRLVIVPLCLASLLVGTVLALATPTLTLEQCPFALAVAPHCPLADRLEAVVGLAPVPHGERRGQPEPYAGKRSNGEHGADRDAAFSLAARAPRPQAKTKRFDIAKRGDRQWQSLQYYDRLP
jgi:hypothetical protein